MKSLLVAISLLVVSMNAKSQCTVTIIPEGTDTMCFGSNILLHTNATFPNTTMIIDQEQTNYNGGMSALTGPDRSEFQTFIAGMTGTLVQIDMGFFNYISGVGVVNFYAGNGITGTLLNTQNVNVNCPSGNCMITFNENSPITAGNAYTFQFIPGAGMPYPYGVQVQNPGTYNNGELFITDPSGTYPTGMDMVFKTYVGSSDSLSYLWSTGSTDSTIQTNGVSVYSVTVTGSACTAVDSINIIVINLDTAVSISGNTLTAAQGNASYQWVDCDDDYSEISGATNQLFTATANGHYAVEISQSGCSITTSCFEIGGMGISDNKTESTFELYPNPADGIIAIKNRKAFNNNPQLKIENIFGQIVFEKKLINNGEILNINILPTGTYFVFIQDDFEKATRKLIIR